jgi:hypothetical protein
MFDLPVDGAVRAVETLLYSISTILYLPVLLGIAALVLHMLVCLGTFVAEWRERRRGVRVLVDAATVQMEAAAALDVPVPLDARLERLVQRTEAAGVRRLDGVRFVVRVGPALGLMGTLIPMGISLAGLACSVCAYVLTLAREHWLRNDLTDVAYAAESLLAGQAAVVAQDGPHLVRSGG